MIGNQVCGTIGANTITGEWYYVKCEKPISGDFVKVVTTRNDYLQIAGVKVFGVPAPVVAPPAPVKQIQPKEEEKPAAVLEEPVRPDVKVPTAATKKTAVTKSAPAPKEAKKEVDVESIMLMEFEKLSQSDSYDDDRFPAINALSDGKSFQHTGKGINQYW